MKIFLSIILMSLCIASSSTIAANFSFSGLTCSSFSINSNGMIVCNNTGSSQIPNTPPSGTSGTCASALSSSSSYLSSASGTGNATITAASSCAWSPASNASWLNITSSATGTGNGTVTYSVTPNTNANARTGTLTVGGATFSVIQNGTGADGFINHVQTMYIAYFGRPGDPGGVAYYSNLMYTRTGVYAAMLDDFATSTESMGVYSQSAVAAKVNQVYRFLFSRDADPSGSAYWTDLISSGQITLSAAAYTIAFNAQSADAAILAAKQSAVAVFTAHLDTAAKVQAYANNVVPGRTWLSTVVDSSSASTAIATVDRVIAGF